MPGSGSTGPNPGQPAEADRAGSGPSCERSPGGDDEATDGGPDVPSVQRQPHDAVEPDVGRSTTWSVGSSSCASASSSVMPSRRALGANGERFGLTDRDGRHGGTRQAGLARDGSDAGEYGRAHQATALETASTATARHAATT